MAMKPKTLDQLIDRMNERENQGIANRLKTQMQIDGLWWTVSDGTDLQQMAIEEADTARPVPRPDLVDTGDGSWFCNVCCQVRTSPCQTEPVNGSTPCELGKPE